MHIYLDVKEKLIMTAHAKTMEVLHGNPCVCYIVERLHLYSLASYTGTVWILTLYFLPRFPGHTFWLLWTLPIQQIIVFDVDIFVMHFK